MSFVLFEKVIGLLDTIQERIEQLDKARSVVDFDIINKELNNVATAISSVQKVKELLGLKKESFTVSSDKLMETIKVMIDKQREDFDNFKQEFLQWAERIREHCNNKVWISGQNNFPDSKRILIGMLTNTTEPSILKVACAYVAHYEKSDFFYFTPNNIDYQKKLIKGFFYINNEWVSMFVRYPDVIYDRLRLRGFDMAAKTYKELAEIPFTNERYGNSVNKLEIYDKLRSTGQFKDVLIPYARATTLDIILDYMDRYKMIILKPEVGSFGQQVFFITETDDGLFFIAERGNNYKVSRDKLICFLSDVIDNEHFIVQKYIMTRTKENRPFDIRVHLMKDRFDEWSIAMLYPRIGIHFAVISSTGDGGYIGGWPGFVKRNFPECKFDELDGAIRNLSVKIATAFENVCRDRINEVALDIAIDRSLGLYLIELNANMPGIIYYDFEVARRAIPHAIYIAKQIKNSKQIIKGKS